MVVRIKEKDNNTWLWVILIIAAVGLAIFLIIFLTRNGDQQPPPIDNGCDELSIPVNEGLRFRLSPEAFPEQVLTSSEGLMGRQQDWFLNESNNADRQIFQLVRNPNATNQFALYVTVEPAPGQAGTPTRVYLGRDGIGSPIGVTNPPDPIFDRSDLIWVWHPNCQMLTSPDNQYSLSMPRIGRGEYIPDPTVFAAERPLEAQPNDRWNFNLLPVPGA